MTLRDINLVPADVLYTNQVKHIVLRWGLILTGALIAVFSVYGYQSRVVIARLRPSTTLADMHARLGATLDDISATQKAIEQLSTQQSILKELSVQHSFPDLLHLLANIMNAQTWLTDMQIETGDREARLHGLRLKGHSVSNELLADFLTQLSAAGPVESVVLKLAQEARLPGLIAESDQLVKVVAFEIECRLKEIKS